ncbi:MAG: N-acetyltransferase [bacterium]|nr:N-acetyltransferase [bacterium]
MFARFYDGADDLSRLQAFNAAQIAQNPVGWLQPGDIPHRLYNGQREHDPEQLIRIWEDENGRMLGWAFVYPEESFDIQASDPLIMRAALAWVESALPAETLETDVWSGDAVRRDLLLEHGFTEAPDELPYYETIRELDDTLPQPLFPDGFSIRTAVGVEDAAQLAAVHAGAFGSDWTAESYAQVMTSPGYAPEREFVVVAPDGRFAAFTVTWHDTLNKTGYFEPVGTHADFQRLGLARALMLHAMHAMRAQGLQQAIVAHEAPEENPASAALYRSLGFVTRFTTHLYRKTRMAG